MSECYPDNLSQYPSWYIQNNNCQIVIFEFISFMGTRFNLNHFFHPVLIKTPVRHYDRLAPSFLSIRMNVCRGDPLETVRGHFSA